MLGVVIQILILAMEVLDVELMAIRVVEMVRFLFVIMCLND